jgi:hypothetical protein
MMRKMGDRSHELAFELVPTIREGSEQPPVRVAVVAELYCGLVERAAGEHCSPVVEWVSHGSGWLDEVELEAQ